MKTRLIMLSVLLMFACSLAVQAQEPMPDIRARMKKRFKALQNLKAKGKIGETRQGWLEAIDESSAKDPVIKKFIDEENADRAKLYKIIAKRTDTTPKAVGEQNALRIFKKAGLEDMFKGADGKWRPKKQLPKPKPGVK